MSRHRMQAAAHHQAGHAVAALSLRLNLRAALRLRGGEDFERHHWVPPPSWGRLPVGRTDATREVVERRVICCLAGPEAERRFSGNAGAGVERKDRERAEELVALLATGSWEREGYVSWLEARAVMLVRAEWQSIRRVARALLEDGELTAGRLRQVHNAAPG